MIDKPNSELFASLGQELLAAGLGFRFQARGMSMYPTICDGEVVHVKPVAINKIKERDIVLFSDGLTFRAHRVTGIDACGKVLFTRGDAAAEMDGPVCVQQVLGKVVAKEQKQRCDEKIRVISLQGKAARVRFAASRMRVLISHVLHSFIGEKGTRAIRGFLSRQNNFGKLSAIFLLLALFAIPKLSLAQVVVDSTSSSGQRMATATPLTFGHTTAGTNRVMVVSVSINLSLNAAATVSSITYNGAALTLAGAHNDATNTKRIEMWYMVGPAIGTNNVVVTVASAAAVGVVAGATTFTGADQTSPIRPFVSANGANATFSDLDVPSGTGEMVIDTVTIEGDRSVTGVGPSQVQQWGLVSTAGGSATRDVYGNGSTRTGAPSVPMSENFSGNSNWSMGALSVRPLQADLSVSVAGTSALYPGNLSYTITVKNNGTSAAAGVTLTDTLAAGLTWVSTTPSIGSCVGTTSISCALGALAVGASATVTVVATPSASGGYPNNASVTATTADLNLGNNSASGVAFSQANTCTTPTNTAGTPAGVVNTYFPGTASVTASATSITVGAARGLSTPIAIGDLLIVMQMQNASINSTNTSSYGDGVSGSGSTNINNSGIYEFVTATSALAVGGGTVNIAGAGPGGGLLYSYTSAAATATQGISTFQVIRVPHYGSATIGAGLTASAWNGASGGVLALDVENALNVGAANTITVNALGFRGGAGMQLTGNATATNADYVFAAPAAYAGAPIAGAQAPKGEGIAGTPLWVESAASFLSTVTDGYPVGSMARGAPGNAGGGGTDADPAANDDNAGGGGGANGGAGGYGGNSWNINMSVGGLGGTSFPASVARVTMGGGGGAGSRNNSDGNNQASGAATGGGIVILRAGSMTGTATISANGAAAYAGTANDAGGGGGAGGTIVVLTAAGPVAGLTISANGGKGGDAWDNDPAGSPLADRHGPGGGGGGGVVLLSGAPTSVSVTGGPNGTTLPAAYPYGATSGVAGLSVTNATLASSPGPISTAPCADVSITKSAAPNPVKQGQTLTYTVVVKNNGAVSATGIVVTDPLPIADVSFVSVTTTAGTCSQSAGTVTCNVGTLVSLASATITIKVTANTPSQAVNTASVTESSADPNITNNSATQSELITFVTQVNLETFTATSVNGGVSLKWKTGGELRNLGFNVYSEVNGERVRLNPSLIAGSALRMRNGLEQHGAKTYGWIDRSGTTNGLYWLEDVDLSGTRTFHGPVTVSGQNVSTSASSEPSITLRELNNGAPPQYEESASSHIAEAVAHIATSSQQQQQQFQLAAHPAVKIFVRHEGWYRVTQPELVAAGLSPFADPSSLRLFAEGTEQAIRVENARSGSGGFGPQASIEFYGTGIDGFYSDRRVYWLVSGNQPGKRISRQGYQEGGPQPQSFMQAAELKQRTTYFAALRREDTDNFFGAVVTSTPVEQVLNTPDISASLQNANLRIVLQGATDGQAHDVTVTLNGVTLGALNFIGQIENAANFDVPAGTLREGANTVTMTAQNGENDISVVDYIQLAYPRTYRTQNEELEFTAQVGDQILVSGFHHIPTRLVDVTNSAQPVELVPQISLEKGVYSLQARVPWSISRKHTLLAVSDQHITKPFDVLRNQPSEWHGAQSGGEVVMISYPEFAEDLKPLVRLHKAEGKTVAVVSVNDVYDEFNFGERSPYALRSFLKTATQVWANKPKYLLLVGDASLDPRDYLGFGYFDFVPTRMVPTTEIKTASDDWFSDFNDSGFAQIATGRLPVRTRDEASTVVGKIATYASAQAGGWTNQTLMVADRDSDINFTQEATDTQNVLPKSMNVFDVFASNLDPETARQEILTNINSGQLLVNYTGHGSVEVWSGETLLDDTSASTLTNGNRLPVFLTMNCLNGYFQDVYTQSLAETLLLSNNGGGVAVWASSGLNQADPQAQMNKVLVQTLFAQPTPALGDAIIFAKSGITDPDVRKTYILFGDPLLRLKWPSNGQPTN